MSKENEQKVVYKFSRLFVLLIVVLVIAVCLQSIYIFNLSREINGTPGILPTFCKTRILQRAKQPRIGPVRKVTRPITPAYAAQQQKQVQPKYNIIRTSPRTNVNQFQNKINQMLNNQFFAQQPISRNHVNVMNTPTLTMKQKPNEYLLRFILPGMDKKGITIKLRNNILTVSGKNHQNKTQNSKNSNFTESSINQFTQSIAIPSDVDSAKIKSNYTNGILTIVLPKTSDQKSSKSVNID